MIAMTVALIVAGISLPSYVRAMHTSKLRGVASDLSGLVQVVRIRAVQDGKYYTLRTSNVLALGYVDLNGNGTFDAGEPSIPTSSEVTIIAAANAPATNNLKGQFLPSGSAITVYDGGPLATPLTPIMFSSRGIPCKTQTATGGTVCESGGGAIPFWIFFRNTISGEQEAITVNPAGRVRKWYYGGGAWNAL
jgi:Tfp pilus assembly protein FimT